MAQWLVCSSSRLATACRAHLVQNFQRNIMFLNAGTLLYECCVLWQVTLASHALLHSGVNEYLVGQRCQLLYDKLLSPNG